MAQICSTPGCRLRERHPKAMLAGSDVSKPARISKGPRIKNDPLLIGRIKHFATGHGVQAVQAGQQSTSCEE